MAGRVSVPASRPGPSGEGASVRRAVLERECASRHSEDGAREGARFIAEHIIRLSETAFDDFAGGGDAKLARRMPGLGGSSRCFGFLNEGNPRGQVARCLAG